jgi:hypothetical protein
MSVRRDAGEGEGDTAAAAGVTIPIGLAIHDTESVVEGKKEKKYAIPSPPSRLEKKIQTRGRWRLSPHPSQCWPQHWLRCQRTRRHLPDSWQPWAVMDGGPLALTLPQVGATPLTLTLTPVAHREGAGNCITGMVGKEGGDESYVTGGAKDLKCPTLHPWPPQQSTPTPS